MWREFYHEMERIGQRTVAMTIFMTLNSICLRWVYVQGYITYNNYNAYNRLFMLHDLIGRWETVMD